MYNLHLYDNYYEDFNPSLHSVTLMSQTDYSLIYLNKSTGDKQLRPQSHKPFLVT